MAEIILIEILASIAVVSFVTFFIVAEMRKSQRFQKTKEQGKELIRLEKELDRTDAIKRGLHLLKNERLQKVD